MNLRIDTTPLPGVKVLRPEIHDDPRGFFIEAFRADRFTEAGLPTEFVQDNHSRSRRGVLRGLHFQWDPQMGKLMRVACGKAFLVAVDIRKGSPTLGRWFGVEASDRDHVQVWAPPGFARGFCVLSESADVQYKCTGIYNRDGESGLRWDDPEIGIEWPISEPLLSPKDASAQTLAQWLARPESDAFRYSKP